MIWDNLSKTFLAGCHSRLCVSSLSHSSLSGACSLASGRVWPAAGPGHRSAEEQSLSWVFALLWPLGKLLHGLSSEVFLPGARASGPGLAHQPPAGWRGPRRRWCGGSPKATQPAAMKVAPDLLAAVPLCLGLGLRSGAACCGGHFDGEDRCPLRTSCRPPPLVTMEHTWLLPVGDSMNINTPYFTFITFLLGFHGDGACE